GSAPAPAPRERGPAVRAAPGRAPSGRAARWPRATAAAREPAVPPRPVRGRRAAAGRRRALRRPTTAAAASRARRLPLRRCPARSPPGPESEGGQRRKAVVAVLGAAVGLEPQAGQDQAVALAPCLRVHDPARQLAQPRLGVGE